MGGLAALDSLRSPFVVAVIDNDGGRIFDQLPVQRLYADEPEAAKLWLTPPGRDLSHAAALFGMSYAAPTTAEAVTRATRAGLGSRQPTLLHLRVGPHSAARMRQQVLAALAAEPAHERGG